MHNYNKSNVDAYYVLKEYSNQLSIKKKMIDFHNKPPTRLLNEKSPLCFNKSI